MKGLSMITLSQAAKLAPGRPHASTIWRWCRRGVLSRNGERIRLEHIRMGGKIFTKAIWVEAFGRQLAAADAEYFADADTDSEDDGAADRNRLRCSTTPANTSHQAEIDRELEEAGL